MPAVSSSGAHSGECHLNFAEGCHLYIAATNAILIIRIMELKGPLYQIVNAHFISSAALNKLLMPAGLHFRETPNSQIWERRLRGPVSFMGARPLSRL